MIIAAYDYPVPLRYPPIEPYDSGWLDVGGGQRVYWEASGNPAGKPALALHGGPGSGMTPGRRRSYDPQRYRLIQFDQRGCGRSTPPVSDPATSLETNTTHHLIADIEQLRTHLGVERWLVWGGSWGVTLALAYAQRFPHRVTELVLVSVTMTRASDVRWLAHEAGRFFPEQWARFRDGVPESERGDLIAAYNRLINRQPDPDVRDRAIKAWCAWEEALLSLDDGYTPGRFDDPVFRTCFARLVTHYFAHAAWLEDGELLGNCGRLAGIPGVLIHGRLDISGPPDVPWLLAQAWPDGELYLVSEGHAGGDEMTDRMMSALERFADA